MIANRNVKELLFLNYNKHEIESLIPLTGKSTSSFKERSLIRIIGLIFEIEFICVTLMVVFYSGNMTFLFSCFIFRFLLDGVRVLFLSKL